MILRNLNKKKITNISINVYSSDGKNIIFILKHTAKIKKKHVDLIYFENQDAGHFC